MFSYYGKHLSPLTRRNDDPRRKESRMRCTEHTDVYLHIITCGSCTTYGQMGVFFAGIFSLSRGSARTCVHVRVLLLEYLLKFRNAVVTFTRTNSFNSS